MNEEMIGKLKEAKSVEDVVAIAKEYGKDLAVEQAKAILDRVKAAVTGELSDDALGAVAGGAGGSILHDAHSRIPDSYLRAGLMGRPIHPSVAPEQTVEDAADPHNW